MNPIFVRLVIHPFFFFVLCFLHFTRFNRLNRFRRHPHQGTSDRSSLSMNLWRDIRTVILRRRYRLFERVFHTKPSFLPEKFR